MAQTDFFASVASMQHLRNSTKIFALRISCAMCYFLHEFSKTLPQHNIALRRLIYKFQDFSASIFLHKHAHKLCHFRFCNFRPKHVTLDGTSMEFLYLSKLQDPPSV